MSDFDSKAVLSKVKKLFALSQSPNESEAALAMEKAHALLKEHNLSINDISQDSKYDIKETLVFDGKYDSKWKSILLAGTAEANYCTILKARTYDGMARYIVGKEHNAIVAIESYKYLVSVIERLSKKISGSDRGSYKMGMASILYKRLKSLMIEEESTCTALVVQEKSMVDSYLKEKDYKTTSMVVRTRNQSAYLQGIKDGNGISLNKQIKSNKESNIFIQ